ncbi:hypothetical protein LSTR_LSTR014204 [Laodelphax striatellus]|uniref:Uncharacterized protein n=1 Tax=Laodelphax striatellus TaxID=195883 RepID=A0A482X3B7_LAOST|nr:hypothetical protein LSTR_LSTR014204 [Laodelphax striatellus]
MSGAGAARACGCDVTQKRVPLTNARTHAEQRNTAEGALASTRISAVPRNIDRFGSLRLCSGRLRLVPCRSQQPFDQQTQIATSHYLAVQIVSSTNLANKFAHGKERPRREVCSTNTVHKVWWNAISLRKQARKSR